MDAVGEDDDGDRNSSRQVGDLQRFKQAGDRTIEKARRSAVSQGDGPATYIERQEVTYSGRRVFVQRQIFENQDDIGREFDTYVPVAGYEDMRDRLDARGLLLLCGVPGSGRNATARMLLRATGRRRLGTLSVNSDDDLFFILHDHLTDPAAGQPLMQDGDGYVIEGSASLVATSALTGFAEAVKAAGARVVVVIDGEADAQPAAAEFERTHPWPATRSEVMAKHLDVHLRGHQECCDPDLVHAYRKQILDHQLVHSRLNLAASVLRIVEMARFLAGNLHEIPVKGVGQLVGEWDDSARVLAREILRGQAPPEKPHLIPQQQAFRIAYAVFHQQPLAYVFEAADLLLDELISVEIRKRPPKSRVFDRSVEALIHPRMVAKIVDGDEDQPRCARLADESLLVSVLEVAWHEYAQLRRPLGMWLDDLAGGGNPDVRIRAAQIAGLLATFDYQGVFDQLIKHWAKRRAIFRGSAALAMDQIARHEPLAATVRRRIADWSSSKLVTEQDTAARWYGLRTDRAEVPTAIGELRSLGSRPQLRGGASIAVAMSLLFLNGNIDDVVDELGRWIGAENPYLPHHAVRTLLTLTDQKGSAKQARTRLSSLAAVDAERQRALVDMWRRALASRTVSGLAWRTMRDWLLEADGQGDQAAVLESLTARIFTDALVPRARFNLTLWQRQRPDARLIGRVRSRLSQARGS
jgi:hypothetical protein